MGNIITPVLPHDLPENWNDTQYVSPGGTEVGLTEKHGYNYLMKQVNNSQKAINELDAELENIDTTLQNKAPAGYGLGGGATKTVETDFNNYIDNGVYQCPASFDSIQNAPPNGHYGMLIVSHGSNAIVQDVYGPNWGSSAIRWFHIRRVSTSSNGNADSWSEWEWPEPPMEIGVEYRTTDLINGKAVYKRNINGVIQYRLDGETDWKPYADAVGAVRTAPPKIIIHVSNSKGDDSTGNGSTDKPFKTLTGALSSLQNKDCHEVNIYMAPEQYPDVTYFPLYAYGINMDRLYIGRWGDSGYVQLNSTYINGIDSLVVQNVDFYGTDYGRGFQADNCGFVWIHDCKSTSSTKNIDNKVYGAFSFYDCTSVLLYDSEISNKFLAVLSRNSMVSVVNVSGTGNIERYNAGTGQGTGGGIIFDSYSNTCDGKDANKYGGFICRPNAGIVQVTPADGFSYKYPCHVMRNVGTISVSGEIYVDTALSYNGNYVHIATLPEGYRPMTGCFIVAHVEHSDTKFSHAMLSIGTDGKIFCRPSENIPSGSNINMSFTLAVSN